MERDNPRLNHPHNVATECRNGVNDFIVPNLGREEATHREGRPGPEDDGISVDDLCSTVSVTENRSGFGEIFNVVELISILKVLGGAQC